MLLHPLFYCFQGLSVAKIGNLLNKYDTRQLADVIGYLFKVKSRTDFTAAAAQENGGFRLFLPDLLFRLFLFRLADSRWAEPFRCPAGRRTGFDYSISDILGTGGAAADVYPFPRCFDCRERLCLAEPPPARFHTQDLTELAELRGRCLAHG